MTTSMVRSLISEMCRHSLLDSLSTALKFSIFSIWAMLLMAATLPAIREEMEFRLTSSISPEEAMQWPSESVMKTTLELVLPFSLRRISLIRTYSSL